jgi:hypothetical protein
VRTPLDFEEICDAVALADLISDAENDTQFAQGWIGEIAINISVPYEDGKLHEWDATCPKDANVGISIVVPKGHDADTATIAGAIEAKLGTTLFHHRTHVIK